MQPEEGKLHQLEFILSKGKGKILVNNKELSHYFGRQVLKCCHATIKIN